MIDHDYTKDLAEAYAPWSTDAEAEAIRKEAAARQELEREWSMFVESRREQAVRGAVEGSGVALVLALLAASIIGLWARADQ